MNLYCAVATDKKCTYEFDIHEKKPVNECNLCPSSSNKSKFRWLYAVNNKYEDEDIDQDKIGKWMIFSPKKGINAMWHNIKVAIENGELWQVKVSTVNHEKCEETHAVFIYTKDYSDVNDVICVLDYIESSNMKPADMKILYSREKTRPVNKKRKRTNQDNNKGGNDEWIYSSDTIRSVGKFTYNFDIHGKELILNCTLYPTEVDSEIAPWLYAKNNKYPRDCVEGKKIGKWMLFLPEWNVNTIWDKIKAAVANGDLWSAKVSTNPGDCRSNSSYAVFIQTKDYNDLNDVYGVLDYLESAQIKPSNVTIKYKANRQINGMKTEGGKQWLYSSDQVEGKKDAIHPVNEFDLHEKKLKTDSCQPKKDSIHPFYEFDVRKKKLKTDCHLYPTETLNSEFEWLFARNNKYAKCVDPKKVGKWILLVQKNSVNATWSKIKMAVTSGELWRSKVSTTNPKKPNDLFTVYIYTKDFTDVNDVIHVLDYLESSEIKLLHVDIKYKKSVQTGGDGGGEKGSSIYSSDTIRSMSDQHDTNLLPSEK